MTARLPFLAPVSAVPARPARMTTMCDTFASADERPFAELLSNG
jgi:hypothetical protein